MEKNIFKLDNEQLKAIARSFKEKVEKGLNTENAEIQCIPTFITPKADNINGKSLVLDLGGTNYRVALVDFSKSVPDIHPNNGWKKDMSIMKSLGYTQEELFKELADMITGIKREEEMPIGYCFSYPTESVPGGDAKLPTDEHYEYMAYPRLLAIAEVAWSEPANKSYPDFRGRVCREIGWLRDRGYHPFPL